MVGWGLLTENEASSSRNGVLSLINKKNVKKRDIKHPFMAVRFHRSLSPVGPLSENGYSGIMKKVTEVTEAEGEGEEEEEAQEGGGRE